MLKPLSLALMVAVATPAAAQITIETQPASAPAPAMRDGKDPNRIICEKQQEIGSRLSAKKACKTALEWQLERMHNRRTIEDVQRQATSTGAPAG